ncbi:MAG: VWA domain-containing protein, partial [Lentisphaeraceae bacterium]|nr:VWA domain-containing protein [Lentisphaeraceae bacterium]
EMLTFNVGVNKLFSGMSKVTPENQQRAQAFLDRQRAKGGTDLRPVIQQAYSYRDPDRQLNVIVLSDGMTEQGSTSELMRLVQQRPDNTRVFCIGVGNDVNRPLLKDIATRSGGLASFISRGDNFERRAKAFRRKLLRPAVSNIKIDFSSDVYDIEPQEIPNLYHGTPIRIYGRYKNGGPLNIKLRGDLQGREFKQAMDVEFPERDDDNPELERMWAWQKVQRLLKVADRQGDRSKVIPEIIRLGEAYSIVTEYTSFLVLENDGEYKRWKIERKNMLRIDRDRKSQKRLQDKLTELRQNVSNDIGPADQPQLKEENRPAAQRNQPQVKQPQTQQKRSRPISRNFGGGGAVGAGEFLVALLLLGSGVALKKRKK